MHRLFGLQPRQRLYRQFTLRFTCDVMLACGRSGQPSLLHTLQINTPKLSWSSTSTKHVRRLVLHKTEMISVVQKKTKRAIGGVWGWRQALPSPWGDDTSAAPETSSGSSRSHFYSLSCRVKHEDKRLRSAACWRSLPSSSSSNWESPDSKFPNLCNVRRPVMYMSWKRKRIKRPLCAGSASKLPEVHAHVRLYWPMALSYTKIVSYKTGGSKSHTRYLNITLIFRKVV